MLFRLATLLTVLTTASSVAAGLIEARAALERRQNPSVNSVSDYENDYSNVNFTTGANGQFIANWNNGFGGDFVVGRGYQPARDLLVNYTGHFQTNGNAYLALYGWTNNPLVEYYVIESLGIHNPSDNVSATQYGCLESDGGFYEIWQKERINAPSIIGDNTNFQQYWSIRTKLHVGGTINTGNHYRAWEAAGLKLGTQLFMDMVIEGQVGGGSATITVGALPSTSVVESPTPTYRSQKAAGTCSLTRTSASSSAHSTTTTTKKTTTTPTSTTHKTSSSTRKTSTSTPHPTTTKSA